MVFRGFPSPSFALSINCEPQCWWVSRSMNYCACQQINVVLFVHIHNQWTRKSTTKNRIKEKSNIHFVLCQSFNDKHCNLSLSDLTSLKANSSGKPPGWILVDWGGGGRGDKDRNSYICCFVPYKQGSQKVFQKFSLSLTNDGLKLILFVLCLNSISNELWSFSDLCSFLRV